MTQSDSVAQIYYECIFYYWCISHATRYDYDMFLIIGFEIFFKLIKIKKQKRN